MLHHLLCPRLPVRTLVVAYMPFCCCVCVCRLGVMQQREHAKQLAQDMDPMIARELEEALAPPPVIAGSEVRRRDWGA